MINDTTGSELAHDNKNTKPLILIVDDFEQNVIILSTILEKEGYKTLSADDGKMGLEMIERKQPDLVLLDLDLPELPGQELLEIALNKFPQTTVIITTANEDPKVVVACMKAGAFDYLVKPIEPMRAVTAVKRALGFAEQKSEIEMLKKRVLHHELDNPEAFAAIVTENPNMKSLFQYVETIAITSQPVLIVGETGVGKELMAQAVHKASGRTGEFVPVNVAGLDDQMFSDTLFGHVKGAFTGADKPRPGLVEKAENGTLFLDEIGDLKEQSQIKLLRLLQEKEYMPIGSDYSKKTTARIVLATHRDLAALVEREEFRQDLYYRLISHLVQLPPLRDNKEDIPLLLDKLLEQAALEMGKTKPTYPQELPALLKTHSFPGNIRELRGMVYDAMVRHQGRMLGMDVFKNAMNLKGPKVITPKNESGDENWVEKLDPLPTLKEASAILVQEALKRADNNQGIAARMLGISRPALCQRLKRSQ